jgi:uncharacterized membrane protein YjfL (UPF0719 family)
LDKKKAISRTLVLLGGAIIGLVLLWEATSVNMDMKLPVSIDWGKIGSVIVNKVADIVRQFFVPR